MINEKLLSLCATCSYVPKSRKYKFGAESTLYTLSDAVQHVISDYAVKYPVQYNEDLKTNDLSSRIQECIKDACVAKKKKNTSLVVNNISQSTYSTGISSKLTENPVWVPSKPFNAIDAAWCSNLFVDINSIAYKMKPNGCLEVLGNISNTNQGFLNKISRKLDMPDPFDYIKNVTNELSVLFMKLQEYEQSNPCDALDADFPYGKDADGTVLKKPLRKILGLSSDAVVESIEEIQSKLVYNYINTRLPSSPYFGLVKLSKHYDMFLGDDGKEHPSLRGLVPSYGAKPAITKVSYLENVFAHYSEYLNQLDERPSGIPSNGNPYSLGKFNWDLYEKDSERLGTIYFKDSICLKTVLAPMTNNQKIFYLGWTYATITGLNPVVSLLQEDDGGTLKTTEKSIAKEGIKRYYEADLTFTLKGDSLVKPDSSYDEKRNMTLADAVFIDVDEPPQKGEFWNKIKEMTGGYKVDIPVREMYHNTYHVEGCPVFWIASNKEIYLSDVGAYTRRLATIATKGHDTYKNLTSEQINLINTNKDYRLKEFHLLIDQGKIAYNKILEQYGSIVNAACSIPEIKEVLDTQTPWKDFYEDFYYGLFDGEFANNEFRYISNAEFTILFEKFKKMNKPDFDATELRCKLFCKNVDSRNVISKIGRDKVTNKAVRYNVFYRKERDAEIEVLPPGVTLNSVDPFDFLKV